MTRPRWLSPLLGDLLALLCLLATAGMFAVVVVGRVGVAVAQDVGEAWRRFTS
jgi:roadblock/LC7 domain-containing protein